MPCLLTTWAFAYLSVEEREAFVATLERLGRERPLAWISAEGPEIVDLFDLVDPPDVDGTLANVLGAVLFTEAGREPTLLGYAHAHGEWLDWRGPA